MLASELTAFNQAVRARTSLRCWCPARLRARLYGGTLEWDFDTGKLVRGSPRQTRTRPDKKE